MMIDLPYVQKQRNHYRYRRKVPKGLVPIVGKPIIFRPLGATEAHVVRNYPKVHAEVERMLTEATKPVSRDIVAADNKAQQPTPFERYQHTAAHVRGLGLNPEWSGEDDTEGLHRQLIAESIAARYPVDDDGHAVGVTDKDAALMNALMYGARQQRPDMTLADAQRIYLKERVQGTPDERKKEHRVNRVVGHVYDALGRKNVTLRELTKLDALAVREHMLSVINTPSTVKRYLNDLRAIVSLGIDMFGLDKHVSNPFTNLGVKTSGVAKDDRQPFTADQLTAVRRRVLTHAKEDLRLVWRLLQGTGCRLAEVTGLLVSDVVLDHRLPYLNIVFHEHRRLKTKGSVRRVPLVGDALEAAREAVGHAEGPFLFAAYRDRSGADAASAALMKHLRACVSDKKVTVHSLRHTLTDKLRVSGATTAEEYLILGRSTGAPGEAYGGDEARLEVATSALTKALIQCLAA